MTTTTLADAIVDSLRRGDVDTLASLYAPDALVDLNVPQWRWQLAGAQVRRALDGELLLAQRQCTVHRVTSTDDGLIIEEETSFVEDGETRKFRQVHVYRLSEHSIVEEVVYCTGIWDAATTARQAVEAPMIRD